MNECYRCPHRAELNPQFKELPFEETPCFKCSYKYQPQRRMVEFSDSLEHPSRTTWKIEPELEFETRLETFRYWLDVWTSLTPRDRFILEAKIRNPGDMQTHIARKLGVTKQAVNNRIRRFRKRFPGVI